LLLVFLTFKSETLPFRVQREGSRRYMEVA
jgi:hypothetical protein